MKDSNMDFFVIIHLEFLNRRYCDDENVIGFVGVVIVSNGETEILLLVL